MNRRFFFKGVLSALITYQISPRAIFAQTLNTYGDNSFYKFVEKIDKGILGWDFGTGMHNFQCHAFDTSNSHLYTLQHSTRDAKGAKISRFHMEIISGDQIAIDSQQYDIHIGHQMLSVENTGSQVKLWAAKGLQESISLIRFDYIPHGKASNIEEYVMFNPKLFGSFYITGNISSDQKWVIVRGKTRNDSKKHGMNCIAIFDLKTLVSHGPGNVWHLAEYLWSYDYYLNDPKNTDINPQSIFSDGVYIYLLFGPLDINKPNLLRIYNFNGELLFQSSELALGKLEAHNIDQGTANEMEGAQIVKLSSRKNPVLTIGYVRGGPEFHKGIYIINDFLTT